MGLFGLFGKKKEPTEEKVVPWKLLNSMAQLEEIMELSDNKLAAIFKHSTRCPSSRMAFRAFESGVDPEWEGVELYLLDLLSYRAISDEVANRFQVWHESPQLILIKNGKVVHHGSHYKISAAAVEQFI
ncbi:MAG TPA: bacillithiol system redox-active protein YtxJ [Flavobacteriaceae bacterium]|nr:bacillithiol system redox-active protein YtxJ [Flavobacteriaceae bacterium]